MLIITLVTALLTILCFPIKIFEITLAFIIYDMIVSLTMLTIARTISSLSMWYIGHHYLKNHFE
jgi:hypothetical protein